MAKKRPKVEFTPEQARLIVDAHEVEQLLDNEEEVELLAENNPEILSAYRALVVWAHFGDNSP